MTSIRTNTVAPTRSGLPLRPRPPPPQYSLIPSETDSSANRAQIEFLRAKHKQLMAFLEQRYPNDRRTQTLRINLITIRSLPEYVSRTKGVAAQGANTAGYRVASFAYETGVLEVAPRDEEGVLRPRPKLLMSYLHEAGHCLDSFMPLPDDHGQSWRSHVLWLTNIATKDLKWDVQLSCYYCDNYLMCSKHQCPSCDWECPPDGKEPETPALSVNSVPGFHKYSVDAYKRVCVKQDLPYDWWKGICTEYETKNGLPRRPRLKSSLETKPPPPPPPAKTAVMPKPAAPPAKTPGMPNPGTAKQPVCACTMEYRPVCADGVLKGNRCMATCGQPNVVVTNPLVGQDGQFSCPKSPAATPKCTCKPANDPVCVPPLPGQTSGRLHPSPCLARCADPSAKLYRPTRAPNGSMTCPPPDAKSVPVV